jgi:tRNA-Thr(GGU) m(6)t(6)A37 methyltransferase TsaA
VRRSEPCPATSSKTTIWIVKLTEKFHVFSVGIVKKERNSVAIVVHKEYAKALLGLNQFSHIVVMYWFHKNDSSEQRKVLQVHPRRDKTKPLTGVFATRSPSRPNLIGISICKILSFDGNVVYIDEIDAFHDSPVIDIKPYIPEIDLISGARVPWWVKNPEG